MSYIRNIYYNLLAISNNIIINFLLLGNLFYPAYFNDKIIHYKTLGDNYYKVILLLNFGDNFKKKYKIDIINIGLSLYDKYKIFMSNYNNEDNLSEISDISDISDMSDINDDFNYDYDLIMI